MNRTISPRVKKLTASARAIGAMSLCVNLALLIAASVLVIGQLSHDLCARFTPFVIESSILTGVLAAGNVTFAVVSLMILFHVGKKRGRGMFLASIVLGVLAGVGGVGGVICALFDGMGHAL